MPFWTQNPTIVSNTYLSSGELETTQKNIARAYDAIRAWPSRARYSQSVGGTQAYASANGVSASNWPIGATYPIWGGLIYKTTGRDQLFIQFTYQASASAANRIDIYINGVLAEAVTCSSTSSTTVTKTYSIGSGNSYGVANGAYYQVLLNTTNTGASRLAFISTVEAVEGRIAGGSFPSGFPTMPTFLGATALSVSDANTMIAGADWLYGRLLLARRVGFSGFLTGFLDSTPAMAGTWIRHAHYSVLPQTGRRTLRLRGRHENRGGQGYTLRVRCNGTTVWSQAFTTTVGVVEPWDIDVAVSGLSDGTYTGIDIDYQRTSGGHFPRPRICLFDLALAGQDSDGSWADQTAMPVGGSFDPRSYLSQLKVNVQGAKNCLTRSTEIERDLPFSYQWDTSARYANHPGSDPNDVDRKEQNPTTGPACFERWGDALHVVGIRPRIVWGPLTYSFTTRPGGDETVTVTQPYEYVVNDDPDAITTTSIYLDSVRKDGMAIPRGQRYRVIADRLYYAAEGLI